MKKYIPFLFVLLLQGCLTGEWKWDFGTCRETSAGVYSCNVKVLWSPEVVNIGADIYSNAEKHSPIKSLKIQIENEESNPIQIQGISPSVVLNPGETHEFSVTVGEDVTGPHHIGGAYICAFNSPVRVKFTISGENLDGAIIKLSGAAGWGP